MRFSARCAATRVGSSSAASVDRRAHDAVGLGGGELLERAEHREILGLADLADRGPALVGILVLEL